MFLLLDLNDAECHVHHLREVVLALFGGGHLSGYQRVADRAHAQGAGATACGVHVERGSLHLYGQDTHLLPLGGIGGVIVEGVRRIDITHLVAVTQFLGLDYYSESLKLEDWNYLVIIEPAEDPNHTDFAIDTAIGEAHIVPVSIVMYETRPINIVLGKK